MTRYYRSQREYGDNICTAVCYNVAMQFLGGCRQFSAERMDEIMRESAEFHQGTEFAHGLMGVFDVMRLVPLPAGVRSKDFGGMLASTAVGDDDYVEGLVVMSLFDTLQMLRETTLPVAFIATFLGHSIVFLAEEDGGVRLFDPLPASLVDVTDYWRPNAAAEADEPYSGVLFGNV